MIKVRGCDKYHISEYLADLKRHENLLSVLETEREKGHNSLRLSLIEKYDDMITSLANEMGAIRKGEFAKNGEEFWHIVIPYVNKESFLQLLPLYGEVKDIQTKRSEFADADSTAMGLTNQESFVLKTAFEMGFFEYPKRAHLKDIAAKTSLSIPTINQYIRISQKKLLTSFMESVTVM